MVTPSMCGMTRREAEIAAEAVTMMLFDLGSAPWPARTGSAGRSIKSGGVADAELNDVSTRGFRRLVRHGQRQLRQGVQRASSPGQRGAPRVTWNALGASLPSTANRAPADDHTGAGPRRRKGQMRQCAGKRSFAPHSAVSLLVYNVPMRLDRDCIKKQERQSVLSFSSLTFS